MHVAIYKLYSLRKYNVVLQLDTVIRSLSIATHDSLWQTVHSILAVIALTLSQICIVATSVRHLSQGLDT